MSGSELAAIVEDKTESAGIRRGMSMKQEAAAAIKDILDQIASDEAEIILLFCSPQFHVAEIAAGDVERFGGHDALHLRKGDRLSAVLAAHAVPHPLDARERPQPRRAMPPGRPLGADHLQIYGIEAQG